MSRMSKALILITLILTGLALMLPLALADSQTIKLRSGTGVWDSNGSYIDKNINMLLGPNNEEFAEFTSAHFAGARNGMPAYVLARRNASWVDGLPSDSRAWWISTNPEGSDKGQSALYALAFQVDYLHISSADMWLYYAVDNAFGGSINRCIYLNERPLYSVNGGTGSCDKVYSWHSANVSSLLKPGLNWMYFNVTNTGAASGLIFSATIGVGGSNVPEPTSLIGLSSLMAILAGAIRRRKK